MNPDTPSNPRGERGTPDDAAAPDIGALSGLGPMRPAEFSDEALEGAAQRTGGFVGSMKTNAVSQLNAQKTRATDQLENIAASVRQSTRRLREEQHDAVAAVLERGVNELERFTTTLRERDINEFIADLERFGRQQPALLLGSSFVAGLALARFAKASNPGRGWTRSTRIAGSSYSRSNRPGEGVTGQENL
jgi:hypothetical protein